MQEISGQEAGRSARGGWRELYLPRGRNLRIVGGQRRGQNHDAANAGDDSRADRGYGAVVRTRHCGTSGKSARELRISFYGDGAVSAADGAGNGGIFRKAERAGLRSVEKTRG